MANEDLRISPAEAKARVDAGKAIILDSVAEHHWSEVSRSVKGAIRINPDEIDKHYQELPKDKDIIAYCT